MQVNVLEAKNRLSQLIRAAQAGAEVVIANRGEPVVRLVAIDALSPRVPAARENGFVNWLNHNPLPSHLRTRHGSVEAGIAEERAGWD